MVKRGSCPVQHVDAAISSLMLCFPFSGLRLLRFDLAYFCLCFYCVCFDLFLRVVLSRCSFLGIMWSGDLYNLLCSVSTMDRLDMQPQKFEKEIV